MKDSASIQTLCLLRHEGSILLGMKKTRFGAGRYNGFGGKVEPGESVEAAALREMKEESGLEVHGLEKFGLLEFFSPKRPRIEAHLFSASDFSGTLIETEEMRPQWFTPHELPFTQMWQSDLYWYPLFLRGQKFTGRFEFDSEDRVVAREITVVPVLYSQSS